MKYSKAFSKPVHRASGSLHSGNSEKLQHLSMLSVDVSLANSGSPGTAAGTFSVPHKQLGCLLQRAKSHFCQIVALHTIINNISRGCRQE